MPGDGMSLRPLTVIAATRTVMTVPTGCAFSSRRVLLGCGQGLLGGEERLPEAVYRLNEHPILLDCRYGDVW